MAGILYGGYVFFVKKDSTAEFLARWTGTLQEVSEKLPEDIEIVEGQDVILPEKVIDLQKETIVIDEVNQDDEFVEIAAVTPTATEDSDKEKTKKKQFNTVVEFVEVDETPKEVSPTEEMPKDLSLFAEIQSAIIKAKENKDISKLSEAEKKALASQAELDKINKLTDEEKEKISLARIEDLEKNLDSYRQTLAGAGGEAKRKVSPKKYFQEARSGGAIPEPQPQAEEKSEMVNFNENPYGLPVIPEPQAPESRSVRTINDFDVSLFQPAMPRVKMPKHVKPSFRSTGFPELQVLSFIPGKGLIAASNGREGVLLIGESLDGWELISVATSYAEFSDGSRRQIIELEKIGLQ